jgi:hypothetical protein
MSAGVNRVRYTTIFFGGVPAVCLEFCAWRHVIEAAAFSRESIQSIMGATHTFRVIFPHSGTPRSSPKSISFRPAAGLEQAAALPRDFASSRVAATKLSATDSTIGRVICVHYTRAILA